MARHAHRPLTLSRSNIPACDGLQTQWEQVVYSIDTNDRLKLITVTYSGPVDIAERSRAWDVAAQAIDAMGTCRILLDFMAATVAADDFASSQAFARRLTDLVGAKGYRVAYLFPQGARVNRVVDMLTEARGLTLEKFNDRVEALRWLLSDRPDQRPSLASQERIARGANGN